MSPKDATFKAMEEISGPVVGIALVLSAVFVPTAFIPGITGRLYQQFAVTIAISVILSAFNALTLSPALAALLLRPGERARGLLRRFFDWFNRASSARPTATSAVAGALIRKSAVAFVAAARLCRPRRRSSAARLPSSFLPDEDQGYMYLNLQLPNAASLQRTEAVAREDRGDAGEDAGRRIRRPASSASACSASSEPATTRSSSSRLKEWERTQDARRAVPGHQGSA